MDTPRSTTRCPGKPRRLGHLVGQTCARPLSSPVLASAGPCGAACSLGGLRRRHDLTRRGVREGSSASWPPSPEGSGRRCCGGRWVRSFTVRAAEQMRGVQGEGAQKDGTRGPITCHTLGQGAQVCLTWALTAKSEALDDRGQDVHRRWTLRPPATPGDPRTVGPFEGLVAHGVCLGEPIRRKPAPRCVKNDLDTSVPFHTHRPCFFVLKTSTCLHFHSVTLGLSTVLSRQDLRGDS